MLPAGFAEEHDLAPLFPGFQLTSGWRPKTSLVDSPDDRIFWRTVPGSPPNLLILDTPDIDSDAQVNWRRADAVRRVADVLIAVLTQQKYNDAAVKQYFRKAAEEGKVVLVIFNQCQLPEDDAYWPLWLETFCRETGVAPRLVYVAPNDRRAAEEGRLPFFELSGRAKLPLSRSSAGPDGAVSPTPVSASGEPPSNLARDFSELKFAEIKLGTLVASLQHLIGSGIRVAGLPARS